MVTLTKQQNMESVDNDDVILSIRGVSKKFCRNLKRSLLYGVQDIAAEMVGIRDENSVLRSEEFWALKDVTFELHRGEALGLVGKNGSGKSTLLRIIAGLIKPDTGSVEVCGRVAPLIALGAGFSPILTGRENIYTNMSILGLSTQEIRDRFDEVVEFAEIGDAIDAPVQNYSSGMAARLGFACAIHTDPDILLIDEVLAVGDSRFRAKCFRKLHDLRQKNTAFVLVNHDAHAILTVCDSAAYLNKGNLVKVGDTAAVMRQYEEDLVINDQKRSAKGDIELTKPALEATELDIRKIFFRDAQGELLQQPVSGMPTDLCIECQVHQSIDNVGVTVIIREIGSGYDAILSVNCLHDKQVLSFNPGKHEIRLRMPYLGLKAGFYSIDIYAKRDRFCHLDAVEDFRFQVEMSDSMDRGLFYQPRSWHVVSC
jgi:lipopolysaccharide transport system ATP-binding protein